MKEGLLETPEELSGGAERAPEPAHMLASAISFLGFGAPARAGNDGSVEAIKTTTPIKHVIIIVRENRSFDHLAGARTEPGSLVKKDSASCGSVP